MLVRTQGQHDNKNINSNFSKYAWETEKPKGPFQTVTQIQLTRMDVFQGAHGTVPWGRWQSARAVLCSQVWRSIVQDTEFLLPVSQSHFPRGPCPELVKPSFSPNATRGWVATFCLLRVSSTPFFSVPPTLLRLLPTPLPSFIPQYPKGPHPQTEGVWVWAGRFQGFCLSDKECGVRCEFSSQHPGGCQGGGNKPKVLGFEHQYSKKFYLAFSSPPHPHPASTLLPPLSKQGTQTCPLVCLVRHQLLHPRAGNNFHLIVLLPLSAPSCRNYWWQNSSSLGPGQMSPCHSAPTHPPQQQDLPAFFFLFSHRELGSNSVVEHLSSMQETLDSIPSTTKNMGVL